MNSQAAILLFYSVQRCQRFPLSKVLCQVFTNATWVFVVLFLDTRPHTSKTDLLPPLPECGDNRRAPPHGVYAEDETQCLCMLGKQSTH